MGQPGAVSALSPNTSRPNGKRGLSVNRQRTWGILKAPTVTTQLTAHRFVDVVGQGSPCSNLPLNLLRHEHPPPGPSHTPPPVAATGEGFQTHAPSHTNDPAMRIS